VTGSLRHPRPGLVGWVLLAVALAFCIVALAARWNDVSSVVGQVSLADLLAAAVAAGAGMLLTGLSWRAVLVGLGPRLSARESLAVFTAAQLGKYVPGSVWVVAIQADLGRRHQIRTSVMALSYAVAALVALATGALLALVAMTDPHRPLAPPVLAVVAAAGLVLLAGLARPQLLNRILRAGARLLRRDLPSVTLSLGALARAVLWEGFGWIGLGLHVWLLARPLGAPIALLPAYVGAFALAFVAGLALLPLPAGLGVREGLLVVFLTPSLGAGPALTVALVSRLVLVVVDLALAGALGGQALVSRARAAARDGAGPAHS
jgi:uncharacterized membrane protein YbhN (UPF0104 family)